MLPARHQLGCTRRRQRGQKVSLCAPELGKFIGVAINPCGQSGQVSRPQGGGFCHCGAHHRDAEQIGLELHQQVIHAGPAIDP